MGIRGMDHHLLLAVLRALNENRVEYVVVGAVEWHEVDAGEGVMARVATPRMLYRMKRDTIRPQDRADAHALRERFGLEDV